MIKSYKRYNYFAKIFLLLDYLLFIFLVIIYQIFFIKNFNNLGIEIFLLIFILLFIYLIYDIIHYILYTKFKLKACYFIFNKKNVTFSILTVSKTKKRNHNPTFSAPPIYSRGSKGYQGILVKENVCLNYDEIINVDFYKNLNLEIAPKYYTHQPLILKKDKPFRYSTTLDLVIMTKDKNYFILSDQFSISDMKIIYYELKNRIKDTSN